MRPGPLLCVPLVLALAAPAPAAAALRATGVRIADRGAYVRAVVEYRGGTLEPGPVMASDPDPFPDGRVRITVPGARGMLGPRSAAGLTARVRPGGVVALRSADRRFKYAGYRVFRRPERLVVDVYKARSTRAARFGRPGCLTITTMTTSSGRVRAAGTERGVFEHSFGAVLRRGGAVLRRRAVAAAAGRWSTTLRHRASGTGMLEAVELSAKDGALSCLAQRPVSLVP